MAGSYPQVKQGRRRMEKVSGQLSFQRKSDSDLIQIIAARGSKEAFTELFKRYEKIGYQVAKHITADHHLAEEAVLDAMHRIWHSAKSFNPEGNARGWIIRIIARSSLKELKRKGLRGKRQQEDFDRMSDPEKVSKENPLESNEMVAGLKTSLRDLPPLDRNIIALRFVGGLSQAEIGVELSMSQRTVSERISQALASLRRSLTRAGLAAALPLVSAEGITEAISDGAVRHPALLDEALNRILDVGVQPSKSRALGVGMALICLVAAFGAIAWHQRDSSSTAEMIPVALPAEKAEPFVKNSNEPFYRIWNFNKSDLDGLITSQGNWNHRPLGGPDGSGCMRVSSKSMLFLGMDVLQSDLPLNLSFKVKMKQDVFPNSLLHWGGGNLHSTIHVAKFHATLANRWSLVQCYITREKISVWIKGAFYYQSMGAYQNFDRLTLRFREGWQIDDLEVKSVPFSTIPDTTEIDEAVSKIPQEKRQVFHLLPELTKINKNYKDSVVYRVMFYEKRKHVELETQTQTWNFQKPEEMQDFAVTTGEWCFVPKGGKNGTGCVEFNRSEFRAFFDCNNREAPFVVTARFRGRSIGNKYGFPALLWLNFNGNNDISIIPFPVVQVDMKQPWVNVKYYVTNQYIDMWIRNQRVNLKVSEVYQLGSPYFFSNFQTQMDFLEIKSIAKADLPKLGSLRADIDRVRARRKLPKKGAKRSIRKK